MKIPFPFVPFPREIWNKNIDLSQAEFRLLGWFLGGLQLGVQQCECSDIQILKGFKSEDYNYPPLGLSRNAMQKARGELVKKGFLEAKQNGVGGGRGKISGWSYQVNLSDFEKNHNKPLTEGQETSHDVTINLSQRDTSIRNIESTEETETPEAGLLFEFPSEQEKPKIDLGPSRMDIDRYCNDIYGLYPRKIAPREAKTAIEKAMRRLVNGENPGDLKNLDDAYEWLFRRTQAYAKSRKDQDEQYTPHPATWFNGGRYLDQQVKRA